MKILHTSDWHLGKRLYGKLRFEEQRELLREITELAKNEGVDVVLVAGDVFDTAVPSAEAERLFYECINALSKFCVPIIIHGNHDDEHRLLAPNMLALTSGIVLAGDKLPTLTVVTDYGAKITTNEGNVRIEKNGEALNVAFMGYPDAGQLLDRAGDKDFSVFVAEERKKVCQCFKKGEINVFLSHLFVSGSEDALTDERELGGSKLVNKNVLRDELCVYTALGHVHKPMTVSQSNNVYYSGSITQYAFDDDSEKSVIVAELSPDASTIKRVALSCVRKTVIVTAKSEEEIERELDKHANDYVLVRYESDVPLTPSFIGAMRKKECFCAIEVVKAAEQRKKSLRRGKTDRQLFEMFYEKKRGAKPSEETIEMFLAAVSEVKK